ncbi:MAG TPA: hypothetical protein VFF56_01355 [Bacillota bacterium]|nr:hypothetical protein [Bacillota bacterium]
MGNVKIRKKAEIEDKKLEQEQKKAEKEKFKSKGKAKLTRKDLDELIIIMAEEKGLL